MYSLAKTERGRWGSNKVRCSGTIDIFADDREVVVEWIREVCSKRADGRQREREETEMTRKGSTTLAGLRDATVNQTDARDSKQQRRIFPAVCRPFNELQ